VHVLVLGATGYVGGRLVPQLLAAGHRVRCAARTPAKLDDRPWRGQVEVVAGDVNDRASMDAACADIDAVVFLVHAMDGGAEFARREAEGAAVVRDAAAAAGVERIVYLGGLGRADDRLSEHLESRHEVGRVLADGPVPVTELRAAVVIGSGSASFEMLRHLVEVLPAMIAPRWVDTRTQPIAIRDVLRYLVGALESDEAAGTVLEIGGPDVLTYRELMQLYAEVAGLRPRIILPVPVLTPRLSSLWIGLVTPLQTGLARPLIDSLVNEVIIQDDLARRVVPFEPMPIREAITIALARVKDLEVATTWASAGGHLASRVVAPTGNGPRPEGPRPEDPDWAGGTVLSDTRRVECDAPAERVFDAVTAIGGAQGYHTPRFLWEVRGGIDKLFGGVGIGRGRRHPTALAVGDAVDFWRVERLDRPSLLRLRAEMLVPGHAWLEFRVEPDGPDRSILVQQARFHPRGLWGRVYWYALSPFHAVIFPRMARELARDAERRARAATSAVPGTGVPADH
jgi:uncharacterized protein YbjT (DUF2867 family)